MPFLALAATIAVASAAHRPVIVRDNVLRWADDGSEVTLFGVNYYPPFSQPYQAIRQLGLDHTKVIEQDVAHFARLGLDVIRLHCWDRELADEHGNLLDNDHLRLLDYLISCCKQHGIYAVLTPIAWWGSPEGKVGFSSRFTMHQMTTDPEARECQTRYLAQFVSHVNPYTKLAYKDDPAIVCFEAINEPLYPPGTTDDAVVEYINSLVDAIRATGCTKPVFFNCWGGREQAVVDSIADGASHGWYPTGLVAGASLHENFLPRVAHYPYFSHPALAKKPKIIYEFDAADVGGSYIYPAMARSFREAGVQIAAQFQYDCLPLAPYNLCWQTHYLNLVYAPAKALSFAIAARAFHLLPRGGKFPDYPDNSTFGAFRVSYEENISEFVTPTEFMYSNNTSTQPPVPESLERVWGCGSSPLVEYEGTGAYFLDRLKPGVWRLEIFPDAVWVADPFGSPSLAREVSRLIWAGHPMTLRLSDLGPDFIARQLAPRPSAPSKATLGQFLVTPGVWVLTRPGTAAPSTLRADFVCPEGDSNRAAAAWCLVPHLWREGIACPVRFMAALSNGEPKALEVWAIKEDHGSTTATIPIPRQAPYTFTGELPAEVLRGRRLRYAVALQADDGWHVLPLGRVSSPQEFFEASVREVTLWQATNGRAAEMRVAADAGPAEARVVQTDAGPALRVEAEKFGPPPSAAGLDLPVLAAPATPSTNWGLCIEARSLHPHTSAVEVTIKQSDGAALGYNFPLTPIWEEHCVPLANLRHMWNTKGDLDVSKAQSIAIVFGAWLYPHAYSLRHGFEIRRVYLRPVVAYELSLLPASGPIPIVGAPCIAQAGAGWSNMPSVSTIPGSKPGTLALRFVGGPFGPPPDCVSIGYSIRATPDQLARWRQQLAVTSQAVFIARAGQPNTTAVEIVFVEEDGTPWGINLELAPEWRETQLPLTKLRHWSHWNSGPPTRGGPGDHFRPEHLSSVKLCFGAWLFGDNRDQTHIVDIELIGLSP